MMTVTHQSVNLPYVDERRRLISYSIPCAEIALLDFLQVAQAEGRVYWENDRDDVRFAGFGVAAEIVAYGRDRFQSIQTQIDELFHNAIYDNDAPLPRLFGGFAFRHDFAATGIWSAFPAAYFVLPRYLLTRTAEGAWLTVNHHLHAGGDVDLEMIALEDEATRMLGWLRNAHAATPAPHPGCISMRYPLTRETWQQQIEDATQRMRGGEFDKVVLSRICDLTFAEPVQPLAALENLKATYGGAYRFLMEVLPGHAFFGATPEVLAAVRSHHLTTGALAGSKRRGATAEQDEQLAADLLGDAKERHEHHLVVESLREDLEPLTHDLSIAAAPTIVKLANIQHLYTPISAEVNAGTSVIDIVERLHPTPALGGYPQRTAMEAIKRIETVERGWYASPIGWIDPSGDGVFAVAIRSAVSAGTEARLYAGAGIVADSDPSREWDETGLKFKPLLDALGVRGDVRAES